MLIRVMREKVAVGIASAVFAVVLATVAGVVTSQIDAGIGWPLAAACSLIVIAALLFAVPGDHSKGWK